jgi:hypothetical protein
VRGSLLDWHDLDKADSSNNEILQVSLKTLELCWKQGPDMPLAMGDYLQSVVIQDTAYVSGGYRGYSCESKYVVLKYDGSSGKWAKLPPYTAYNSALVSIDDKLVESRHWECGREKLGKLFAKAALCNLG